MILSFKTEELVKAIQNGDKIHTIRRDTHQRWQPGRIIHFWKGNPRNKGSYPFTKNRIWGDLTKPVECTGVQEIRLHHLPTNGRRLTFKHENILLAIDRVVVKYPLIHLNVLAKNDGLTIDELVQWFVPNPGDKFTGRIIHWSGKTYPDLFTECKPKPQKS